MSVNRYIFILGLFLCDLSRLCSDLPLALALGVIEPLVFVMAPPKVRGNLSVINSFSAFREWLYSS